MLLFLTILLERKDARFKRKWWNLKYFVIVNLHWHIETFLQILSAFVANIIFVLVGNVNPLYREFRWKFKKWRFSLRKLCTYRLIIWRNYLLFCSTFYQIKALWPLCCILNSWFRFFYVTNSSTSSSRYLYLLLKIFDKIVHRKDLLEIINF